MRKRVFKRVFLSNEILDAVSENRWGWWTGNKVLINVGHMLVWSRGSYFTHKTFDDI